MKAKRITAFLMAMTMAVALSACGNIDTAQEIMANNVEIEESEEIESEEIKEEETETTEAETEEIAESEENVEEDIGETEDAVESEEPIEEEVAESKETVEPKTEKVKAETPAQTSAPVQSAQPTAEPSVPTATPETSVPVATPETSVPVATPEPVPVTTPTPEPVSTPTPEPVHEHSWKEHVATTQVWVSNIVVVDDYETKTVAYAVCICDCGFETTDANTIRDHIRDHAYAGDIKGFTCYDQSYTEQVKVGSHEEDQGHYETNSYVDYYYCDCGERK